MTHWARGQAPWERPGQGPKELRGRGRGRDCLTPPTHQAYVHAHPYHPPNCPVADFSSGFERQSTGVNVFASQAVGPSSIPGTIQAPTTPRNGPRMQRQALSNSRYGLQTKNKTATRGDSTRNSGTLPRTVGTSGAPTNPPILCSLLSSSHHLATWPPSHTASPSSGLHTFPSPIMPSKLHLTVPSPAQGSVLSFLSSP